MTLELKKFDMKSISFKPNENKGPVVVLIGKRDTGKSFLVRDLLYYQQEIPIGTVISGTEEGNGFYGKLVTLFCAGNNSANRDFLMIIKEVSYKK